jgi:hypothetical protein
MNARYRLLAAETVSPNNLSTVVACIRIAVQLLKFGNHAGTQGI